MKLRSLVACVAAGCMLAAPAAADINYGNFSGTDFDFIDVTESSGTDPEPLFNAPTVAGNTLDFDPTFTAFSEDGDADITDGQLNFVICAHEGAAIDSIIFTESGDFTLIGGGTDATLVSVAATFTVEVMEVDGVPVAGVMSTYQMTFTPDSAPDPNGQWDLVDFFGAGTIWNGSITIDIEQLLADFSIDGNATKVNLVLDNTLVAQSETGTEAFIAKKDTDGIGITVIPAPGALALLLMAGLVTTRRRRR